MNYQTLAIYFVLGICIICAFTACNEQASSDVLYNKTTRDSVAVAVVKKEMTALLADKTLLSSFPHKDMAQFTKDFSDFYEQSKGALAWQNVLARGSSPQIEALLNALKSAPKHGLNPQNYQLNKLDSLYQATYPPNLPETSNQVKKMVQLDAWLTAAALAFGSDLLTGTITPSKRWEVPRRELPLAENLLKSIRYGGLDKYLAAVTPTYKGYEKMQNKITAYKQAQAAGGFPTIASGINKASKGEKVKALSDYLAAIGDLAADKTGDTFTPDLADALKSYQKRHYLTPSGVVDAATAKALNTSPKKRIEQLSLGLERYRWLPAPETLGDRHVWINIPEYMVHVYDKGEKTADIIAVVGELKNATPVLVGKKMMNVVFSPTWTIPKSIAKEEMQYILQNPAVLVVADVDVWVDGKKVNPLDVDWKNTSLSRVKMRQRPKKRNSMGKAKFQFSNNHGIYLHDTPNQIDFQARIRNASHGCVRLKDPQKLAVEVLKGGKWEKSNISTAMNSGKEQYAKLPQDVFVHVYYMTTWADDDGHIQFRPDVYGHDRRQMKALAAKI